jgi:hypothetical protein
LRSGLVSGMMASQSRLPANVYSGSLIRTSHTVQPHIIPSSVRIHDTSAEALSCYSRWQGWQGWQDL